MTVALRDSRTAVREGNVVLVVDDLQRFVCVALVLDGVVNVAGCKKRFDLTRFAPAWVREKRES